MNAEMLKTELKKKKLSVEKLAEMAGVHKTTIYRSINGDSKLTVETAKSITHALKLKPAAAFSLFFED